MTHDCWNDFTKEWHRGLPSSMTLAQLRRSSEYWIVSDGQLKRDLKPRTIADVYRENAAGRRFDKCERTVGLEAEAAYRAWCKERGHKPHPASLDPEHPIAKQRESMRHVKRG